MKEWQCTHPGCSLYTPNTISCYDRYAIYASTTTLVTFDIPLRRHVASFTSKSGVSAIACNAKGVLAAVMKSGECTFFQVPHLTHPISTVQVGAEIYDEDYASRSANVPIFDVADFAGVSDRYLVAVARRHDILAILDTETNSVARILLPEYLHLNILKAVKLESAFPGSPGQDGLGGILFGGLLSGRLSALRRGAETLHAAILSDEYRSLITDKQRHRFLGLDLKADIQLPMGYETYQLATDAGVKLTSNSAAMIYMTPGLLQFGVGRSTALSVDVDPFNQSVSCLILSVYSCGTLLLHDLLSTPIRLTGRRKMEGARCACFLRHRPGLIAIGFSSGIIKVCNINVLAKTIDDVEYVELSVSEIHHTIVVSRGLDVLALRCSKPLEKRVGTNIYGTNDFLDINSFFKSSSPQSYHASSPSPAASLPITTTYLIGCTSTGSVFSVDCNQYTIHHKTDPSHIESILDICYHEELTRFYMSLSADCTAKLWRVDSTGTSLDGQFGTIGGHYIANTNKTTGASNACVTTGLKVDGGAVDTSQFLGPLICASWDPRPASCLALLSSHHGQSAIVDVWRGSIYAVLEAHTSRVISNAWTNSYGCLCATSSLDGKARIYPFNRSIHLDASATGFTPADFAKNNIEFVSGKSSLYGLAFSPYFPLLACGSEDGKVHIYDVGYLNMDEGSIRARAAVLNLKLSKTVPVPHLGSFKAHDRGCFKVIFHPLIADILATSSHDGTLRVFRLSLCAPISVGSVLLSDDSQSADAVQGPKRAQAVLRISAISTLKGHTNRVRPLKFHPELPHILFSGSWDTTIRAWNWLAGIELACFSFKSDVYGISIAPSHPFELVVSSRDVTIRRIHIRGMELGQRAMIHATLGALSAFFAQNKLKSDIQEYTLEDVADYLTNTSDTSSQALILTAYNSVCRFAIESPLLYQDFKKSYSSTNRSELSHALALLAGSASKERGDLLAETLDTSGRDASSSSGPPPVQLSPNRIFGSILSLFYPVDAGISQLMKLFDYLLFAPDDVFNPKRVITHELALQEFSMTDGIVATGSVLLWEAFNLAKLCMRSLTSSKAPIYETDPGFSKAKYQFYEFIRKQPTLKSEAYRHQFLIALKLFVALGDIPCMIEIFKYLRADKYLNMMMPLLPTPEARQELASIIAEPVASTSLQVRMNLKEMITPLIELITLGHIVYALTGNYSLIRQACYECCASGETTLAKIIAYKVEDADISMSLRALVMQYTVMNFLTSGRPIKAALELVSENNAKLACRILALTGEAFPAALLTLSDPPQGDFLAIYGAAELIVQSSLGADVLGLMLSAARGRQATARAVDCHGIYLPTWFSFIHAGKILRGLHYIKTLLIANTYIPHDTSTDQDRVEAFLESGSNEIHLHGNSPRELFQAGTEFLDPQSLSVYIGRAYKVISCNSTPSVNHAIESVFGSLAAEVNTFILAALSDSEWESRSIELACLYNLIRGHTLCPTDSSTQVAAVLSHYVGGVAALQAGLFSVAHDLICSCTKLLEKCCDVQSIVSNVISAETLKEYKDLALFCVTGNEALCSNSETLSAWTNRRQKYLDHGKHTSEVLLISRSSNVLALRCMFSPFTGKNLMIPILTLIPSADNA